MPIKQPGETGRAQAGPGFEYALRSCLVSGIVVINSETKVATVTNEAREMLALPADSGAEISIDHLPSPILNVAREAMQSGRPSSTRQVVIDPSSFGKVIHVTAVPLTSISSNPSVVLTLHGLNSSGQFQQQIRQLDRLANTGTLAAGMAHEIKNALVAGRTFLDLLLEKNTDEDLVEIVRRENGRIDALVSRMLRFAGTNTPSLTSLRLHEVLQHALRLVQPQLKTRSLSLTESFRASQDTIMGDEYELEQAFVNLLFNALEATSENGQLTVSTETTTDKDGAGRIRITIQDTGTGIAPEHITHLFEPFFTTKAAGTGLGLAVTQRIVEEHGGSISVHSEPGQGTVFTVLLPLLTETGGPQLGGFTTLGRKPG
jgi:signal transduction histidine kinase